MQPQFQVPGRRPWWVRSPHPAARPRRGRLNCHGRAVPGRGRTRARAAWPSSVAPDGGSRPCIALNRCRIGGDGVAIPIGLSRPSADGGDRQLAGIPKQSQTDHPNDAPQRQAPTGRRHSERLRRGARLETVRAHHLRHMGRTVLVLPRSLAPSPRPTLAQ